MGVGSGEQGGDVASPGFSYMILIKSRGLLVLFFGFVFFVAPSPGYFYADALGHGLLFTKIPKRLV